MKPAIAYILKMYPRFSETFIVNEILELERQGVDVRIYSLRKPDDGRFHASLAKVKANVIYVPQYPEMEPDRIQAAHLRLQAARPRSYRDLHDHTRAKGHSYAIKRFLQAGYIANHLLEHPVSAIHAHFASSATRVANLVSRLTGIPYRFTAHAKDIYHEDVVPSSLVDKMRGARFVVTVSDFNLRHLDTLLDGQVADVRRLYNGIDLKTFKPGRPELRKDNRILAVGRLVEKKGFDVLMRACAVLRDRGHIFDCVIIGKGPEEDRLKDLAASLRLDGIVRLAGPRPQGDVLKAYREAAVFALPCVVGSDNNMDGLPTVLLEAMATGLPVVSTTLTGNPEIVSDGVEGFLVPPGNVEALAGALARLLEIPDLRRRMGLAAREKTRDLFDVRKNVAVLHGWLAEPASNEAKEEGAPEMDAISMISALRSPMTLEAIFAAL